MENKLEIDSGVVIEKLGLKLANAEIQLAQEQAVKEHYIKEYHKLKAQTENKKD